VNQIRTLPFQGGLIHEGGLVHEGGLIHEGFDNSASQIIRELTDMTCTPIIHFALCPQYSPQLGNPTQQMFVSVSSVVPAAAFLT